MKGRLARVTTFILSSQSEDLSNVITDVSVLSYFLFHTAGSGAIFIATGETGSHLPPAFCIHTCQITLPVTAFDLIYYISDIYFCKGIFCAESQYFMRFFVTFLYTFKNLSCIVLAYAFEVFFLYFTFMGHIINMYTGIDFTREYIEREYHTNYGNGKG